MDSFSEGTLSRYYQSDPIREGIANFILKSKCNTVSAKNCVFHVPEIDSSYQNIHMN